MLYLYKHGRQGLAAAETRRSNARPIRHYAAP